MSHDAKDAPAKDALKRNAFNLLDYIIDRGFTNILLAKSVQEFFLLLVNKKEDILMHLKGVEKYIDLLDVIKDLQRTLRNVRVDFDKLAGINYVNESGQER